MKTTLDISDAIFRRRIDHGAIGWEGGGTRLADVSQQHGEPEPVECAAKECEPLELVLVEGEGESRKWREHVERYHYLGCCVPFGANLRYWVRNRDRELACLLWT